MKVLVVSRNLIGDALYILPSIQAFLRDKENVTIDLLTMHNHAEEIYKGLGIHWRHIFFSEEDCKADPLDGGVYDHTLVFKAGDAGAMAEKSGIHIAQAYGILNKISLEFPVLESGGFGRVTAVKPFFDPIQAMGVEDARKVFKFLEEFYKGEAPVLLSPFSLSCTSQEKDGNGKLLGKPPNKMLYPHIWSEAPAGGMSPLDFLRSIGPLRLLGSAKEEVPNQWKMSFGETSTLGLGIPETALLMNMAAFVVTVDNGMGHLAASQNAPHFLMFPLCLSPNFIVPWGANWTIPAQVDPRTTNVEILLGYLTRSFKHLRRMSQMHGNPERQERIKQLQ